MVFVGLSAHAALVLDGNNLAVAGDMGSQLVLGVMRRLADQNPCPLAALFDLEFPGHLDASQVFIAFCDPRLRHNRVHALRGETVEKLFVSGVLVVREYGFDPTDHVLFFHTSHYA